MPAQQLCHLILLLSSHLSPSPSSVQLSPSNEMRRANITCLVHSYNGKQLLCSYNDEDIYLFDTTHSSGDNYIRKYSGHRNSATGTLACARQTQTPQIHIPLRSRPLDVMHF